MERSFPTIVPENNLRLPDALTIKHGPARLLAQFVLAGDQAARQRGIRLRLRHDFAALQQINRQQVANGTWFPLVKMYDPEFTNLTPENAYWISGENEHGEIVLTQAGRVHYWPDTTLADEARLMLFGGRDVGQRCTVTAPAAKLVSGVVLCAGAHWIRPDLRGRRLSHLLARLGRAYAVSRWPVDWCVAIVAPVLVDKGVAAGYGYPHASRSIFFPDAPSGAVENVLSYMSAAEAYDDLAKYLTTALSGSTVDDRELGESSNLREDSVTRTSSEGVFQGSSSLS
jgi:hypothetical protein